MKPYRTGVCAALPKLVRPGCRLAGRQARIAGWMLLILLATAGNWVRGQGGAAVPAVHIVHLEAIVNPGSAGLLQYAIGQAEAHGAAALIVRIDTPGGLLSSTRDMVSAIAESRVPVIGYVGPSGASATSAGAFLLLATNIAVMNAGTNVGASSPVGGDGMDIQGTMATKVMNDSRAFMRSIAASRGRNADVAEGFVLNADSLTANEALEQGVIDRVVPDFASLINAVDGMHIQFQGQDLTLELDKAELVQVEPRLIDRLLKVISHPQIAHMLISLGVLAIYIEILSPGLAVPGVVGVIALVLGLVGVQTLPVNVGFLLLLFLGVALMLGEYFVAGFGVLGVGGAIAFTVGSLNLFDAGINLEHRGSLLSVSLGVSAAVLLTTFLISRSLLGSTREKNKPMDGKIGEAMVSFNKAGYVLVEEQRWAAETQEPLRHGDRVVVMSRLGADKLLVRKAQPLPPKS